MSHEQGLIRPLVLDLLVGGLSMLQYADDTVFMFEDDLSNARNIKNFLCIFEHLFGFKINFLKSEVIGFGKCKERSDEYKYILLVFRGYSFKYLGMPYMIKNLRTLYWTNVENKVEKKVGPW